MREIGGDRREAAAVQVLHVVVGPARGRCGPPRWRHGVCQIGGVLYASLHKLSERMRWSVGVIEEALAARGVCQLLYCPAAKRDRWQKLPMRRGKTTGSTYSTVLYLVRYPEDSEPPAMLR